MFAPRVVSFCELFLFAKKKRTGPPPSLAYRSFFLSEKSKMARPNFYNFPSDEKKTADASTGGFFMHVAN